jgi:hypothetical protein
MPRFRNLLLALALEHGLTLQLSVEVRPAESGMARKARAIKVAKIGQVRLMAWYQF